MRTSVKKRGPIDAQCASSAEWEILELLTGGLDDGRVQRRFEALINSPDLRWEELIDQALRHKMLPRLAFYVQRPVGSALLPAPIARRLDRVLRDNRHRVSVLQRVAAGVARRLQAESIVFAATRGVVHSSSIYGDSGERTMIDIDFLTLPEEKARVERVLAEEGFVQGRYDAGGRRVIPFSRRERIAFRLNPYHLPHHAKVIDDPAVEFVDLGFANSMTWSQSGIEIPLAAILNETRPLPLAVGGSLPALAVEHEFLYCAMMIYKYARFAVYLDAGRDVHLAAFCDLIRLWRKGRERIADDRFLRFLRPRPLRQALTWVLEQNDRLFRTGILPALGLRYRGAEDELRTVRFAGGKCLVHRGDLRRRLQSKDRLGLFKPSEMTEVEPS